MGEPCCSLQPWEMEWEGAVVERHVCSRGLGGLCATAESCQWSSEEQGWARDTCRAVTVGEEEQRDISHYLGRFPEQQCRMARLCSCLPAWHSPSNGGTCSPSRLCAWGRPGHSGSYPSAVGAVLWQQKKGLLLGFPEDGCLTHRWLFTTSKLMYSKTVSFPPPRKVTFV